ncbi:adhesin [Providencia manganoxydans]|uniref:adhesin n=1 Tax=Providencia manganoxydans TaxID=2923283 RepID=UPI0032DB1532
MSRLIHNFCQWKKKKELSHVTLNPLLSLFRHAIVLSGCFAGSFLFSSAVRADYSSRIQNVNSGYVVTLSDNKPIATRPIKGSDGKDYYLYGDRISVYPGESGVTGSGTVDCLGRVWGDNDTNISQWNAGHRLFIYAPSAGVRIDGWPAYHINSNLVVTVDSFIENWIYRISGACGNATPGMTADITNFRHGIFPITLKFYVKTKIIDGQLSVPAMDLGGYVQAFMALATTPPPEMSWPIGETTVPIRIAASQLNITPSACKTMTSTGLPGTVNLRHGQLNTLNYDSVVTEEVSYDCQFSIPTKVKLRLDYATDDDPQKRLPMTSSENNKIYSDLSMTTDEIGNKPVKELEVDIKDFKNIKITSHIQGSNAVAGDYKGSAWLIATLP